MDIVKSPEFLIRIIDDTYGMKLEPIEAEMLLGYLEGSYFCLLFEFNCDYHCEVLRIHDNQSTDEDSGEIVYKIAQVIEFCQRCNAAILSEQEILAIKNVIIYIIHESCRSVIGICFLLHFCSFSTRERNSFRIVDFDDFAN